jgi:transposase
LRKRFVGGRKVVQVDEKERIRIAHFMQGLSIREIARHMRHSRKTVRKALRDASQPVYNRKIPCPEPVIAPVKDIIKRWLEEDSTRPGKQRHTAHRMYERLRDEHGFTGGESTVRRYLRILRGKKTESFIPLCFDPGQDAQADFGEAVVVIDGKERKIQLFMMRLSYSHRPFVMALPFQKQEAFLTAQVRAFDFFGGVPRRISYDNLTAATTRSIRGDKRREIDSFIAFRSHYLFESHFCNPGEPHEKGQIENLVGYTRRNWLVPLPRVKDFDELNAYLYRKCLEEDEHVVSGMRQSIGEMYAEERLSLLPLPKRHYECFRLHPARSNKMSIVRFERNSYSVPEKYASTNLFLKAYVDRVEISDTKRVIIVHNRLLGKEEESLCVSHYLEGLSRKPGAVEYARPIKRSEFAPVYTRFLERLKAEQPDAAARRSFIKVLELTAAHTESAVAEAMEMALLYGTCDSDAVKNIISQFAEETFKQKAATLPVGIPEVHVESPDSSRFDQLLAGGVR